jgi:hypothetical protein
LLCFTRSGELIVGASVDDPLHEPRVQESAIRLMDDLVALVGGRHGWVVGETPPPLDPDVERPRGFSSRPLVQSTSQRDQKQACTM